MITEVEQLRGVAESLRDQADKANSSGQQQLEQAMALARAEAEESVGERLKRGQANTVALQRWRHWYEENCLDIASMVSMLLATSGLDYATVLASV